jgi:hypothetical protein
VVDGVQNTKHKNGNRTVKHQANKALPKQFPSQRKPEQIDRDKEC